MARRRKIVNVSWSGPCLPAADDPWQASPSIGRQVSPASGNTICRPACRKAFASRKPEVDTMGSYDLTCSRCGGEISPTVFHRVCPACGGELAFHYDLSNVRLDRDLPGIWRFIDLLPIEDAEQIVSLQEGNTPLISSQSLRRASAFARSGNGREPIRPGRRRTAGSPWPSPRGGRSGSTRPSSPRPDRRGSPRPPTRRVPA